MSSLGGPARSHSRGRPNDVTSVAGLSRTWFRAIRSPWIAAVSAACSMIAVVQLIRLATGQIDQVSVVISAFMVFGPPTVIATLPQATVLWRVAALGVGIHVGPIVHTPMETVSVAAFFTSWGAAFGGDRMGVLHMFLWAAVSMPLLELIGTWVRRFTLAHDADLLAQRTGLSLFLPSGRS